LKCIGYLFYIIFSIDNFSIAGDDSFPLDVQESLGDNGDGCRLLVLVYDSSKGLVLLLAYASIEVFGLGEIFGQVSPNVQGFL
jgi:hypothetical protein